MGFLLGLAIVLPVRSVDHSLSARLIPAGACMCRGSVFLHTFRPSGGLSKAGAQGISIAVAFRSIDRTLQTAFFK